MKRHGRARVRMSDDGDRPSKEFGAFPHAEQPQRVRIQDFLVRDTTPIVLYFQHQHAVMLFQSNRNGRRIGMPSDIRQRFLANTKHRRGAPRFDGKVILVGVQSTGNAGPALKVVALPLNGRD